MSSIVNITIATSVVSLFSLVGMYALSIKEETLDKILLVLVAFSAGSILGAAYFDLLPEAIAFFDESVVFVYIPLGSISFFFLERFIYWYHGHPHEADISAEIADRAATKGFAFLNLIGDGIHNFIDGMIIAASFLILPSEHGFSVGLAATVAVIFHELPQEMGDYGILVYAGSTQSKALLLNFVVALMVVLGGVSAVFFIGAVEALSGLLIALSVGVFIYLAASELISALQEERNSRNLSFNSSCLS